jgi:hypothetical protein
MLPVNTNLGPGMSMGFPDVCLVPTPVGPIPTPFPNIAMTIMANPGTCSPTVIAECGMVMNQASMVMLTNGDNAGAAGGVMSGTMMGPTMQLLGSFKLLVGGMPTGHMTSLNMQNLTNVPCGCSIAPCQVKLLAI